MTWQVGVLGFAVLMAAHGGAANAAEHAEADYSKQVAQPTVCGNHAYLIRIGGDYRQACDQTARAVQATIRNGGAKCDHIAMVSPAIRGTDVAEALCVVRGGDVVLGLTTNTINYLVTSAEVTRLPAETKKSRAAVDAAVSRALADQTGLSTVYLIKAWHWPHLQQPQMVQVIRVESQRVCDALVDAGDSGFGSFGPAEMLCMSARPAIPPEWGCRGNVDSSPPTTYICESR